MLISHIIQVLLCITHQLIFLFYFFSSTHFPPLGWSMLCSFSSYFLSRLAFVQLGILSVVSSYAWFICFILCYLSWAYTFSIMFTPHCKYFFSKFLHPEYGSQCCKYIEPPAPKIHVHTPSTANAFWGHHIEEQQTV